MNPGTIFAKTDKGRLEMADRSGALTSVHRRLLILVDGKKTLDELGAFVRAGELDLALDCLFALDLVAPLGELVQVLPPAAPGFATPVLAQPARAATSQSEFAQVREGASDFVRQRLGSAGEPICAAIDRTTNPQELRLLLRGVEVFVEQRLDKQTTQSFARHFGAMLL